METQIWKSQETSFLFFPWQEHSIRLNLLHTLWRFPRSPAAWCIQFPGQQRYLFVYHSEYIDVARDDLDTSVHSRVMRGASRAYNLGSDGAWCSAQFVSLFKLSPSSDFLAKKLRLSVIGFSCTWKGSRRGAQPAWVGFHQIDSLHC